MTRCRAALALLAVLALAVPVHAQSRSYLSTVAGGDVDNGQPLVSSAAALGFFDANSNGRPDAASPHEPSYLDLDNNQFVSYGDVRLTTYMGYTAGSVVDAGDTDLARPLTGGGWIGQTSAHHWYADVNGDRSVSAGDVDLATLAQTTTSASELGQGLTGADAQGQPRNTVWWSDTAHDQHRNVLNAVYLGVGAFVSGPRSVAAGDLRLQPTGFSLPPAAASPAPASPTPGTVTVAVPGGSTTIVQAAGNAAPANGPGGLGTMGVVLAILCIANLAGLLLVVRRLPKAPPRNPFK